MRTVDMECPVTRYGGTRMTVETEKYLDRIAQLARNVAAGDSGPEDLKALESWVRIWDFGEPVNGMLRTIIEKATRE